ncbi:Protein PIN-LIKES 1 [Linum perenne]
MAVFDLFVTSSISVLKVLLVTALGTFLALDHVDVLGPDARKHVNNVVFYVFNPALMVASLSKTIDYEQLVKLWFMPVNILLTFVVGSGLGWMVIQLTKPPRQLRGLIIGCCAAGNSGNLLMVMIPAVCIEKASPFGSPDACQSYGLAYVSVSMAVGAVYIWTYVYNIMRPSVTSLPAVSGSDEAEKLQISISSTTINTAHDDEEEDDDDDEDNSDNNNRSIQDPLLVQPKLKQRLCNKLARVNWNTIFAPSTIGVMVGLVIAVIPPVKNILVGEDAPLRAIQDSAALLGDATIPAMTLLVGANLLRGLKGSGVKKEVILGVVVARYVAQPIVGIVVVKGALHFGFIPNSDPLYQFILLLQFAVPPAMNIGTMTQLFGAGESECSVIMLWTYVLASVSLTLWSTCFMWLVVAA